VKGRGNVTKEFIGRAVVRSLGAALICGLLVAPAASAAEPSYLNGIDVSHWQGQPNWAQVKADGVRFVFAKATDGRDFVDGEYARNMAGAGSQAIAFGAYHFARPDGSAGDAIAEADHFVDHANLMGWHLLPVLDLEASGGLGVKKLKAWAWAWLNRVESRLGVRAMIYASPSFWRDHMGNARGFADAGHRLWIAHWDAAKPSVPASNWGGRGWTVWQHTDNGSVAGISGDVDRDRLNGTSLARLKIKNNR
jgi:GH25 family lysozyme M1 (1,4-beta-N-acetylmuramidase)